MPAPKKTEQDRPSYHVYKIGDDLGEVTTTSEASLEDVVDAVSQSPTSGLFLVVDEKGETNFVHLTETTQTTVNTFSPNDLFSKP
jgi:heat shock protein HspQ